ncbi:MAG: alpha/beta hydrolase, partial [Candidatus Thorarchaeota archaeon]
MNDIQIIPTEFIVEDEVLKGNFVIPNADGPFPGVCKLHGLPGGSDQISGFATRLAQAGFAVLTFDFRGFRTSDGFFTLSGQIKDASCAITHLLESDFTDESWSGVYAASWGAAVAVCTLAVDSRVNALCLRAPVFDTLWFSQSPMIRPAVDLIVETDPTQIRGIDDLEKQ